MMRDGVIGLLVYNRAQSGRDRNTALPMRVFRAKERPVFASGVLYSDRRNGKV